MEITSLCLIISATLSIQPDRLQFFQDDVFTLSCDVPGNFRGWTVIRNTSTKSFVRCDGWGRPNGNTCKNRNVFKSDEGAYWCKSDWGECSNIISITVNTGVVILESPALPVTEGDKVTLRCSYKELHHETSQSDFNTTFFKNDAFIGAQPEGKMIIPSVSKSDEGFYKCKHPQKGESPQSFLAVIEEAPPPPPPFMTQTRLVCAILLFILYTVIMVVCIYKYRRRAQARADAKKRASDHLVLE